MRIYLDTGIFIDYLVPRGHTGSGLRTTARRGRVLDDVFADADRLLDRVSRKHQAATSALTYYEVEEALYKQLLAASKGVPNAATLVVPTARAIVHQTDAVIRLFGIEVLDLTAATVRGQLRELELQARGVRAADALHLATAISFGADLVASTDDTVLALDGLLGKAVGLPIRCLDSDAALLLL